MVHRAHGPADHPRVDRNREKATEIGEHRVEVRRVAPAGGLLAFDDCDPAGEHRPNRDVTGVADDPQCAPGLIGLRLDGTQHFDEGERGFLFEIGHGCRRWRRASAGQSSIRREDTFSLGLQVPIGGPSARVLRPRPQEGTLILNRFQEKGGFVEEISRSRREANPRLDQILDHLTRNGPRTTGPFLTVNYLKLKVVRKRGFEPLRYCYRQPLKLVRLPVPPLPR